MNKRGQTVFVAFMIGIVCFVLGLALSPAIKDVITSDTVSGVNGLDCSNSSITNQNKAVCTSLDLNIALFTGLIFGLAGFLVTAIGVR